MKARLRPRRLPARLRPRPRPLFDLPPCRRCLRLRRRCLRPRLLQRLRLADPIFRTFRDACQNASHRLLGVQSPRRRSSDRLWEPWHLVQWARRGLRRGNRRGNRRGRRRHHLFAGDRRAYLGSSLQRRDPVLGGLLGLERENAVRKDQARRRQDKLLELFRGSRFTNVRVLAARCRGSRLALGREARADLERQGRLGAHAQAECLPDVRVRAYGAAIRKRNANRKF